MITGDQLAAIGWPKGKIFGMAMSLTRELSANGLSDEQIITTLESIKAEPEAFDVDGSPFQEVARLYRSQPVDHSASIREHPMHAPVWGEHLIDPEAKRQLEGAMRLPVTVAGALMPDAHVGYGIPIGGVVALENAVAPYMVGVDIACRMMMSIYPETMAGWFDNESYRETIRRTMREETRFGVGAKFGRYEKREHDVMDDDAWNATRLLRHLKDRAHEQLGTSGSGNHFIDAGVLEVDGVGAEALGVAPGRYMAVMTHSGSRGTGARIADHYSKLAQKMTKLPDKLRHLAWLDLDTDEGQEYWVSMNLAGRYASANHHAIHRAVAKRFGEKPLVQVENHHNFAWREQWNDRDVIVHRKGATPAHAGVLGIVPGSQGHNSYIVRGLGSTTSLNSASHGAGRVMSRKKAKETIPKKERDSWLRERGVELMAGGIDESPQVYKDIGEVIALQTDLIEPLAIFKPRIVLMSTDGKAED